MKTEKTIKFYQVSCGLYACDSLFPPFANVSGDFIQDLDKAMELYDSISVKSFKRKEVVLAALSGFKTYNKTIIVAEMPESIYEDYCKTDAFGREIKDAETIQSLVNDFIWHEKVKFQDNLKDDLFEIENNKIVNVRPFN
jgi:hypothetical protein